MRRPRAVPVAVALAALLAVAGCSQGGNTIAAQAKAGDGKGYVAGDGTVEALAPGERSTAIRVSGTTLEGGQLDTGDYRGTVVVLNTWGSWCPPCNAEAPDLQKTWELFQGKGVQFVGIDLREGPAAGRAFQRRFSITYPSLRWDGGGVLLQLKGKAAATPTTIVLDKQGRLASRVSGKADPAVLKALVDDALAEQS